MSSDIQAGLQDFRSLCDQTLKAWNQYKFQGNSRGTPAQFFAQKWSEQNLNPEMGSGTSNIPKWLKNAATAIPIVVGVATIIPLGVIGIPIAAGVTALVAGPRLLVDKILNPVIHNDSVAREAFPKMRDDLEKIVNQAKDLARSSNIELAAQGVAESERLEILGEIETTLHHFAGEAFDATSEDIDRGELASGKVKRDKDSTAIVKIKRALDEVAHEKDRRPMVDGSSPGIGGQDLGKPFDKTVDPNPQLNGPDLER